MEENVGLTPALSTSRASDHSLCDDSVLDCISQATELVGSIRAHLSKVTRAWTEFQSPHGDIAYFRDLSDRSGSAAISGIREEFTKMAELTEQVVSLDQLCRRATTTVSTFLRLSSVLKLIDFSLILAWPQENTH